MFLEEIKSNDSLNNGRMKLNKWKNFIEDFISGKIDSTLASAAFIEWLQNNDFTPKPAVNNFSDLPIPADLKDMRGVLSENAIYVFDGTQWIKYNNFNFDALAETEKVIILENYGAVGDGVTDDSAAFSAAINAFPNAKSLKIVLQDKTYKSNKPLIISRRISFIGRGIDKTVIDFSEAVTLAAPYNANVLFVHPNNTNISSGITLPSGQVGTDAKNAFFEDLSIKGGKSAGNNDIGVLINSPIEMNRVRVYNCGNHGVQLIGGITVNGVRVEGNCNHTKLKQVSAYGNGGDGFNMTGSNANTFVFDLVTTYHNSGWGIFDDSFLGGVVIGAEADGNIKGAFSSSPASKMPSRTVWIGTYAEGNQPVFYNLSSRHIILGVTGNLPEVGQNYLGGLVDKGLFSSRPLIVADSEQLGYEFNGVNGQAARLSKNKLELYPTLGMPPLKLEQDGLSDKYGAFRVGSARSILFPYTNLSSVLPFGRPYFATGYAIDQFVSYEAGAAPPTSGSYTKGQRIVNTAPSPGGYEGWICVTSGSPGTWKGYGLIQT